MEPGGGRCRLSWNRMRAPFPISRLMSGGLEVEVTDVDKGSKTDLALLNLARQHHPTWTDLQPAKSSATSPPGDAAAQSRPHSTFQQLYPPFPFRPFTSPPFPLPTFSLRFALLRPPAPY